MVAGAKLSVAAGASVLIESTLTDNGALNFGTGDTVSLSTARRPSSTTER